MRCSLLRTLLFTALITAANAATPTDEQGFLAAIAASPEDDTIRLAYADFIEERGRGPRAEFIRLQVRAERLGRTSPSEAREARKKASDLLKAHEAEWLPEGLHAALKSRGLLFWERGFPSSLSLTDFMLQDSTAVRGLEKLELPLAIHLHFGGSEVTAGAFFARAPRLEYIKKARSVTIQGDLSEATLASVIDHLPGARNLGVHLYRGGSALHVAAMLSTSRAWRSLSISITHQGASQVLGTLGNSSALADLRALSIDVFQPFGPVYTPNLIDTLDAFRTGSGLPNLEELSINGIPSVHALDGFLESDRFRHLRRIRFAVPHPLDIQALAHRLEGSAHNLVEIRIDEDEIDERKFPKLAAQLNANRAKFRETAEACAHLTKLLSEH